MYEFQKRQTTTLLSTVLDTAEPSDESSCVHVHVFPTPRPRRSAHTRRPLTVDESPLRRLMHLLVAHRPISQLQPHMRTTGRRALVNRQCGRAALPSARWLSLQRYSAAPHLAAPARPAAASITLPRQPFSCRRAGLCNEAASPAIAEVARILACFEEAKESCGDTFEPTLNDDGVLWLNLGEKGYYSLQAQPDGQLLLFSPITGAHCTAASPSRTRAALTQPSCLGCISQPVAPVRALVPTRSAVLSVRPSEQVVGQPDRRALVGRAARARADAHHVSVLEFVESVLWIRRSPRRSKAVSGRCCCHDGCVCVNVHARVQGVHPQTVGV